MPHLLSLLQVYLSFLAFIIFLKKHLLPIQGKIDKELKTDLIKNVYQIVVPDDWNDDSTKTGANTST